MRRRLLLAALALVALTVAPARAGDDLDPWPGASALGQIRDLTPPPGTAAGTRPFRILSYNAFLLPGVVSRGQMERARILPRHLTGLDVIVFCELFHDEARELLLAALSAEYPHQTGVIETSSPAQDGGVVVVSRWPFAGPVRTHVFTTSLDLSSDSVADKGVVYVAVDAPEGRVHVFATHLQAGSKPLNLAERALVSLVVGPLANRGERSDPATVRRRQLLQMRDFVERTAAQVPIPASEPVIMAGDFNVDLHAGLGDRVWGRDTWDHELPAAVTDMLATLGARPPRDVSEDRSTWDPATNDLARREEPEGRGEYLDYVLWRTANLAPTWAACRIVALRTRGPWRRDPLAFDLSDHYGVGAVFHFDRPVPAASTPPALAATGGSVELGLLGQ